MVRLCHESDLVAAVAKRDIKYLGNGELGGCFFLNERFSTGTGATKLGFACTCSTGFHLNGFYQAFQSDALFCQMHQIAKLSNCFCQLNSRMTIKVTFKHYILCTGLYSLLTPNIVMTQVQGNN